jgi:glycosyltransferase involved in cell wall biosynthesis
MVLPVPAFRSGPGTFEIESAFAEHQRMLRSRLGSLASPLVLALPEFSAEGRARLGRLGQIDEAREGIVFRPMFPASIGRLAYLRSLPQVLSALYEEVASADVIHASSSTLYRPFEIIALMMGSALGKKTISVTDIDNRRSPEMNYRSGRWSRRELWVTRLVHQPYAHLQQLAEVRRCSLVLMKGRGLVEDYGRGRGHVKHFLDSAFSQDQIAPAEAVERKIADLTDPAKPLRVVYFGRLVAYKGIDHMLRAFRRAIDAGANLRFEIIGEGEQEAELRGLCSELLLDPWVTFAGAVPFGPALFERLYRNHLLLAAPLSQDTPRSALDAFAAGQAILAYDTYYYAELAAMGAPVTVVPWLSIDALGDGLVAIASNRAGLAPRIRAALAFARENTQEKWLDQRIDWTRALFAQTAG